MEVVPADLSGVGEREVRAEVRNNLYSFSLRSFLAKSISF